MPPETTIEPIEYAERARSSHQLEKPMEGKRATQTIKGKSFEGTITRVTKRSVRIVFDDGLTATYTLDKPVSPGCLTPGGWVIHPWKPAP